MLTDYFVTKYDISTDLKRGKKVQSKDSMNNIFMYCILNLVKVQSEVDGKANTCVIDLPAAFD